MKQQRGGLILGLIIGIVIGLAAALAVAVYVTKVPVPFMNKGQNRTADQDAAEARKNKDWDPNAPLYGKNPVRPAPAASAAGATPAAPAAPASAPAARAEVKPAVSADPLGDLARAKAGGADPFLYFIQAGAYRTPEDAEAQRAKLSLIGLEAKVTEREQSGRTVYRVRVGPFEKKDDADRQKERLEAGGVETALVRVQR
ncbi:MAG: SPOR domain-containing protein [Ramlibacter sp.]|nr:SPOR domain-containing protein [Ramlibacter sp.]MBX3659547.1 SPOR domain-containing protein [Ramlibacter sp.]MCW5651391.1 SPOR domain-containing protein [Ramlibacter sp.]